MVSTRLARAAATARLREAAKGEILSPRYEPATMAPAAGARGIPMPCAMPMKAMPTVPAVP